MKGATSDSKRYVEEDGGLSIQVTRFGPADDLELLAQAINASQWDALNDIDGYRAEALRTYLADPNNLFIGAFLGPQNTDLGGIASARLAIKPWGDFRWLYIDEVDTCVNFRRRGVGTALMRYLLDTARAAGCQEVWLGTEMNNVAARALYDSLQPNEVDAVIGYTFRPQQRRKQ